jgi:hypothetical protein
MDMQPMVTSTLDCMSLIKDEENAAASAPTLQTH